MIQCLYLYDTFGDIIQVKHTFLRPLNFHSFRYDLCRSLCHLCSCLVYLTSTSRNECSITAFIIFLRSLHQNWTYLSFIQNHLQAFLWHCPSIKIAHVSWHEFQLQSLMHLLLAFKYWWTALIYLSLSLLTYHPTDTTTSNKRQFDVVIMSIQQKQSVDTFPSHCKVLFQCNFEWWKTDVVLAYFFEQNFDE